MKNTLIAHSSIAINASAELIWKTITDPEAIQKFMLGMKPTSDWKEGSALRWTGRHEEKPDDNARGIIEKAEPGKMLRYTFYYPGYGYPDSLEYYNTIVYELKASGNETTVSVQQGDFSVFKEGTTYVQHSQQFWDLVLKNLKELVEKSK